MEDSISREARGGSPLASCCPHATVFNSIQQPIRVRSLFTNPIEKKKISSSETDTTAPRGVPCGVTNTQQQLLPVAECSVGRDHLSLPPRN
jgi:hypothetical protein